MAADLLSVDGLATVQGCPGRFLAVRGGTAGICYGCARYGVTGPQIQPAAAMGSSNLWDCPNRVSTADVVGG